MPVGTQSRSRCAARRHFLLLGGTAIPLFQVRWRPTQTMQLIPGDPLRVDRAAPRSQLPAVVSPSKARERGKEKADDRS